MTDGQGRSFAHRNRTSHEDKTPLDTMRVSFNRVVNGTQRRGVDQPLLMQRTCDSVKSKSNLIYEKLELLGSAISVSMELDNLS